MYNLKLWNVRNKISVLITAVTFAKIYKEETDPVCWEWANRRDLGCTKHQSGWVTTEPPYNSFCLPIATVRPLIYDMVWDSKSSSLFTVGGNATLCDCCPGLFVDILGKAARHCIGSPLQALVYLATNSVIGRKVYRMRVSAWIIVTE